MEKNIKAARSLLEFLPYMHEKFLHPMERLAAHSMSKLQFFTLMMLYRKGPKTMTELASAIQVSKQQLTPLMDRILEQKLVERMPDPKDRRVIRIEISPAGKEAINTMMKHNLYTVAARLTVLPEEELVELDTMMVRVRELLEKAERLSINDDKRKG